MTDTQISTFISAATKEQLERYAAAHGVKKGHLTSRRCGSCLQTSSSRPVSR